MRSTHRRGRVLGALSSFAIAALLLAGCTGGDSVPSPDRISNPMPDDAVEQMQAATERAIAAGGGPGAIVGVWAPWAGEWEAGIGETEPGSGTAPSTDMTFRAATVTRSMTCDLLYAMDGGPVNLDDAVSTYLQSVPQLTDVTLVDLCNGVAGLRSSRDPNWNFVIGNTDRVWDPREYAAAGLGAGLGSTDSWADSDTSFFLLGLALQNASHSSLPELYNEYIFDPQGLGDTYLPSDAPSTAGSNPLPGFYSSSQVQQSGCTEAPADVTEISASYGYADSGVVSSVTDVRDYMSRQARNAGNSDDLAPRWAETFPVSSDGEQWVRAGGGKPPERIHARPAGRHPRLQRCGVQRRRHGADRGGRAEQLGGRRQSRRRARARAVGDRDGGGRGGPGDDPPVDDRPGPRGGRLSGQVPDRLRVLR